MLSAPNSATLVGIMPASEGLSGVHNGPGTMPSRYAVLPAFVRLMPALRMDIATACLMAFLRDAG